MAASSKPLPRVSTLLSIGEHRQAKVCDSFTLLDEDTVPAAASPPTGKASSGCVMKVMQPLVKLKKAFVEILVSKPGSDTSTSRADAGNGSSYYAPAAQVPAFAAGMGMVPMTTFM